MTLEQVNYLIKEFTRLAAEAKSKKRMSDWSKLDAQAKKLEKWQAVGATGECPVDYAAFHIKLPPSLAKAVETTIPVSPAANLTIAAETTPAIKAAEAASPTIIESSSQPAEETTTAVATESSSVMPINEAAQEKQRVADSWRRELERAQQLLTDGELAQAIILLRRVQAAGEDAAGVYQHAEQLLAEAETQRARRIDELFVQARDATKRSDWNGAEQAYDQILRLDETNQQATAERTALLGARTDKEQQADFQNIKTGLRQLNDVGALGEAVRKAEGQAASHKADEELLDLLKAGKVRWDELRERQGQTTTKARMGSVVNRAEAVHEYEQYIFKNEMNVWDATVDAVISTQRALEEARRNWEDASRQETEAELKLVKDQWPHNIDWAKQRLEADIERQYYDRDDKVKEEPLGYVFQENDRKVLEERLAQIKQDIANRDQANLLMQQTRQAASPEEALTLLLEARSHWPHLTGIDNRLMEQSRLVANQLAERIRSKIREVESAARAEDFKTAHRLLTEAGQLATRMPPLPDEVRHSLLQTIPADLAAQFPGDPFPAITAAGQNLQKQSELLRQQELQTRQFADYVANIKQLLGSPDTHQQAVTLFDEVGQRPEFADHPTLKTLRIQITAFRKAANKWEEIQRLRNIDPVDWKELVELCQALINSKDAGKQLAGEARKLLDEAQLEVRIANARKHLEEGRFDNAEDDFLAIITKHPARKTQLARFIDEIGRYKANNPDALPKMQAASRLKYSSDYRERLQALELFREVANATLRSTYWPEAKKEAQELQDSLRAELLHKIRDADKRLSSETSDQDLEESGLWAAVLRKGSLVWDEADRRAVRNVELAYQERQARKQESMNRWVEAVRIWDELEQNWPDYVDIQLKANLARKQKAINGAEVEIKQNADPAKALTILREEQTRGNWGVDPELNGWLGEAYRLLGQWTEAERCARNALSHQPELLQQVLDDKAVASARADINAFTARATDQDYEAALERLAKLDERLRSRSDVTQIQDKLVLDAQTELLAIANNSGNTIESLIALVRLDAIEKLARIPVGKAAGQLAALQKGLTVSAQAVLKNAADFRPGVLSLEKAEAQAQLLASQVDAFIQISDRFPDEEREDLEAGLQARLTRLQSQSQRLNTIKERLAELHEEGEAWREAVLKNNFSAVETIKNEIDGLSSDLQVTEVRQLTNRLTETKEARAYIAAQHRRLIEDRDNLFIATKNYAEAKKVCDELQNLPPRRNVAGQSGSDWEFLTPASYRKILALADKGLNFYDTFLGIHLSAWPSVSESELLVEKLARLAQIRTDNLRLWDRWLETSHQKYRVARETFNSAERERNTGALKEVRAWKAAQIALQEVLTFLKEAPGRVDSNPAAEAKEEGRQLQGDIQSLLDQVAENLKNYEECLRYPPSLDELAKFYTNTNYFEAVECLIRAKVNGYNETPVADPANRSLGGQKAALDPALQFKQVTERIEFMLLPKYWLKDKSPNRLRLEQLLQQAEQCLGADDTLTVHLRSKLDSIKGGK